MKSRVLLSSLLAVGLLVAFAALIFLHAIAFFWRSYLEWKEGPESDGKYLDKDSLGAGEEAYEGTH